ncbi:MAG: hypothetical protein NC332_05235 [Firmicutes bacterium]|nr:hypothetical protein [Bacillota bacterium]
MKATLKSVAIALSILAAVMAVLSAVEFSSDVVVSADKTYVKVTVVDLDGNPVHNAKVNVGGTEFYTDNKGMSPSIEIAQMVNCYDENVTEWFTATVTARKDGYVPAIVFNCVVYSGQTRKLTVKIYPDDASELPYVAYVESPPDDYVKTLL